MRIASRVNQIGRSAIHEMTRLSKEVDDVAFLSWAKPTSDTPQHIKEAAVKAILDGLTGGYSENSGLPQLREEIAEKLNRDNHVLLWKRAVIREHFVNACCVKRGSLQCLVLPSDPRDKAICVCHFAYRKR